MRFLLTLIGCCTTLMGVGQTVPQSLRLQVSYEKAGQYVEQAVATIEAVNKISASTTVEYSAGRSVTLLPGFEARTGSAFIALVKVADIGKEGDTKIKLSAFPNPFDQATTIDYYLPADGKVNLWITDSQGKIVIQLIQGEQQTAGNHRVDWNPKTISSGVYIPIVEANQQKAYNRIIKK